MSEFILVIIAIILLFSVFRRYIFYFIMKAVSQKLFNHVDKQYQKQNRPEGSVTLDTSGAKKKRRNDDDDGEYVQYEEIK